VSTGGGGQSETTEVVIAPTPAPTPTFIPTPDPTRTAIVDPTQDQVYTVQFGDTLNKISLTYGVPIDSIVEANGLPDIDSLSIGQSLIIPTAIQTIGPGFKIIPDSELVYGPTLANFDVAALLEHNDCYLCHYTEELNGRLWSGPEIIERVALEQSLNPRLLLALVEFQAQWISQPMVSEEAARYPMRYVERPTEIYGLYRQLDWAGKMLSTGYYGWRQRGLSMTLLADGTRVGLDPTVNAGTAGVQMLLAQTRTLDTWMQAVQHGGLFATYVALFGDPFQYAVEPLIPPDLTQPDLTFPWNPEETWYYTGGPHGGWGSSSSWAALDVVPDEEGRKGCQESIYWARAVADGIIARNEYGIVVLDLDGDGFEGTGWTIFYLHLTSDERPVEEGQRVSKGAALGHPACEAGVSYATHLHFARRYNGEWVAADCTGCMLTAPAPQWNIDGWLGYTFNSEYDGSMIKGDSYREAYDGRDPVNMFAGTAEE
jgi:murein DD-endopeptidase MepM/ murein hydrolase activator NlpD